MSILKPAKNVMAYSKVGIYGAAGSGKTFTASQIAIGLHQAIGSKKPIAAFDTEPAFSFVLPLFEKANIELLVANESRALLDLMAFMDEAEKTCDIAIIDSITHVWRDAQESYLRRINQERSARGARPLYSLEFHHWRPIKAAWAAFTDRFLSSKLHVIVCGRAGSIYEYQEKDDGSGKKELITTGTRMATEKELGYEPSLLIEMINNREDNKLINTALIQKDRSNTINGLEIPYPNYKKLEKHFLSLNIGGQHFESMDAKDSKDLFINVDEGGFDKELKNRKIYSEEIAELMKKYYPGQTAEEKKARGDLMEQYFDTRSWTAIEEMNSATLKSGFLSMKENLEKSFQNDVPLSS